MNKFRFISKSKIEKLPKNLGVYAFKKDARLLYIGKAANLKERVKQHKELFSLAKQLGFIKTDSEIEALLLEAKLIKKYQPKYNIVWRDDKNYFFVGVTKDYNPPTASSRSLRSRAPNFPQVFITHQPKSLNTKYKILNTKFVGPFVDGKALKQTLKILRKVFPYRTCKTLPKHPCLWYQLDRCPAPCLLKSSLMEQIGRNQISTIQKESQKNAENLVKILKGEKTQVLKNLKKEMTNTSNSQDYEKAAKIRDQIESLERILAHAKIFEPVEVRLQRNQWLEKRIEAYDVSNIQGEAATGSMVTFINGQPDKNFYRKFKIKITGKPDDIAMLKEVLIRRINHPEWPYPDLILIDGGIAQLNAALKCKMQNAKCKNIKVMAIAKRKNELYIEGRKKPLLLKNLPREIFNLILQLRDEAHRFAISYHKKLRKKALLGN